jgi:hypothetical protein
LAAGSPDPDPPSDDDPHAATVRAMAPKTTALKAPRRGNAVPMVIPLLLGGLL